jgi:hypothetical protein
LSISGLLIFSSRMLYTDFSIFSCIDRSFSTTRCLDVRWYSEVLPQYIAELTNWVLLGNHLCNASVGSVACCRANVMLLLYASALMLSISCLLYHWTRLLAV